MIFRKKQVDFRSLMASGESPSAAAGFHPDSDIPVGNFMSISPVGWSEERGPTLLEISAVWGSQALGAPPDPICESLPRSQKRKG